ncbi:MAG: aminoacetone oxidase family FAD-binding enzyme [Victivallales bacterium]|nr:aminoacetone oxidase family FAD-binding enzyme [Victivallales bacterium]
MNDLIIIGAGAGGLMASVYAAESGINAITLERRHRPGLKLLMCGNNRCNISHDASVEDMLEAYGEPVGPFLKQALEAFSPSLLRNWFGAAGIATTVSHDRIYPATEDADDILHCFTDQMRSLAAPLMLNCPVAEIRTLEAGGFEVVTEAGFTFQAANLLLTTGGVSYPKTGSVGDGQRLAAALGHKVTPLRPALAGIEVTDRWLQPRDNTDLPDTRLTIRTDEGVDVATTSGNILCTSTALRGTAVFDAVRIISRQNIRGYKLILDLFPNLSQEDLAAQLQGEDRYEDLLKLNLPGIIADELERELKDLTPEKAAASLKARRLNVRDIRPLKEAIVTMGGVDLSEVNPVTMESKLVSGLYFAGELLDIDGPTGGYNLHAAFATARLAIASLAQKLGRRPNLRRKVEDFDDEEDRSFRKDGDRKGFAGDRYADAKRGGYGDRPFRKDGDRPFRKDGDRPFRKDGDRGFAGGRSEDAKRGGYGDRPFRKDGDRPFRKDGDRPFRKDGDRPFRKDGDRPFRKDGDRPFRKDGDRPFRKDGDRPFRKDGDRPFRKDGNRPFRKDGDHSKGSWFDRPRKKDDFSKDRHDNNSGSWYQDDN